MKKAVVISLGGSLIVPHTMNTPFLQRLRGVMRKHYKTHKFVIVCGGGTIARKYISSLREDKKSLHQLALAGIRATRMNARFMMQFFGTEEANDTLPMNMKEVKDNLHKNNVVICGALRFTPNATSDATAAKLAKKLDTTFINITNVKGLYSKDPNKFRSAKFIRCISWSDFKSMAIKMKFKPGQNFVLDQNAAVLINKQEIPTYIVGPEVRQLSNVLLGKKFIGTKIEG